MLPPCAAGDGSGTAHDRLRVCQARPFRRAAPNLAPLLCPPNPRRLAPDSATLDHMLTVAPAAATTAGIIPGRDMAATARDSIPAAPPAYLSKGSQKADLKQRKKLFKQAPPVCDVERFHLLNLFFRSAHPPPSPPHAETEGKQEETGVCLPLTPGAAHAAAPSRCCFRSASPFFCPCRVAACLLSSVLPASLLSHSPAALPCLSPPPPLFSRDACSSALADAPGRLERLLNEHKHCFESGILKAGEIALPARTVRQGASPAGSAVCCAAAVRGVSGQRSCVRLMSCLLVSAGARAAGESGLQGRGDAVADCPEGPLPSPACPVALRQGVRLVPPAAGLS